MTVEADLEELLPTALEEFDAFGLLWRRERVPPQPGWEVQEALRPFMLSADLTNEWPGTRIDYGTVCTYRLCPESLAVLSTASGILELFGNGGPEDLAFYREGAPKFISISHEQEAWFAP